MSPRKLAAVVGAVGITIALAGCGNNESASGIPAGPVAATDPAAAAYAAGDASAATDPVASTTAGTAPGDASVPSGDASVATEPAASSSSSSYASSSGASGGYRSSAASAAPAAKKSTAAKASEAHAARWVATELISKEHPTMGNVVTDEKGWVLYRFEKDKPKPSASNCTGECAKKWPPVIVKGKPKLSGVSSDLVGTVKRADGSTQATIGGWPVYYFNGDKNPGEWKGQGVGSTWFVVTKDGKRNLTCLPKGTVVPTDAAAEGRVAAELISSENPSMGNVVTDEKGSVLYRFEKDKPKPSASNCTGECAKKWPPVIVKGELKVKGVSPELVGSVKRADGSYQATIGGWPVYYFNGDKNPGEWKGQGVGSTWFVVTKDGKRNLSCLPKGTVVPGSAAAQGGGSAQGGYAQGGGMQGGGYGNGY